MSEKKVVSRNVAIALTIACVIFAATLAGAILNYQSAIQAITESKDDARATKNSQIQSLNNQIIDLQAQVDDLTEIIHLNRSYDMSLTDGMNLNQTANSYASWNRGIDTAGYISFKNEGSWTTTSEGWVTTDIYAQVIWSAYGINYDNQITIGTNETANFPMLPCYAEIRVGNTNPNNTYIQVNIRYHY